MSTPVFIIHTDSKVIPLKQTERFIQLNVNMQSVFDLYTDAEYSKKEDFTTLNAKVAYRFGTRDKGLNLFVKGENLTATRYTINDGFPMPKAIFMGGIDVTF